MKRKLVILLLTVFLLSTFAVPVQAGRKPNPTGNANRARHYVYRKAKYNHRGLHNLTVWHINRAIGKSSSCKKANGYYTNAMHNFNFRDYQRSINQLAMGNRAWWACQR